MYLSEPKKLQDHILLLLTSNRALSATTLQTLLRRTYKNCSLQAIYKELRLLIKRGVVVKANKCYGLSLPWILESYSILDKAYETYFSSAALNDLLLPGKTKSSWKFNDLRGADDFWIQAVLAIVEGTNNKQVFGWIPHPWFSIIHFQKDLRFQNALRSQSAKYFFMIGGNTFLDNHFIFRMA